MTEGCFEEILMKKFFWLLVLFSAPALAVQTGVEWQLSQANCDGTSAVYEIGTYIEVYADTNPIPASDLECATDPSNEDQVPVSAQVFSADYPNSQIEMNLPGGRIWYFRARVFTPDGENSQLSNQLEVQLPASAKGRPFILSVQ